MGSGECPLDPDPDWVGPGEENLIGVDGLALDPNNPDWVYLALGKSLGGPGGLYRSRDRGRTWSRLMSARFEGNGRNLRWSGGCVAVDPRTSAVIYCGTRTDGLWRSMDGGTPWEKVPGIPDGYTGTHPTGVRAVVFDAATASGGRSSTVYVGIPGGGIYRRTDGGNTFASMPGAPVASRRMQVGGGALYVTHSTGVALWSGGAWRDITPAAGAGRNYCALAVDPADPRKVVVSQRSSSFYNPMFRSSDSGASWQQINTSAVPAVKHVDVPWWDPKRFSSATAAMVLDPFHPGHLYYTDWFGVWRTPDVWAATTEWYTIEKGHEETVVLTLVAPPSGALVYSGMADVFGFRHDSPTA